MYRTTSALALGLFLGLAPAAVQAQQDTQQQNTDQLDIQVQDEQQTQQDTDQLDVQVQDEQQPGQQRSAGLLATDEQALMVDTMIGADVYSAQQADESIGSIDDVLITVDGQVEGVIIGVGGWLGVGQRDVLVSMNDLSLETHDDDLRLMMQRTREELEAEPEFRRVDEQRMGQAQQPGAVQQPGTVQQDTAQQGTAQQGTAQQGTMQQDTMQPEPRDRQILFQDENSILASTMIDTDVQIGTVADDEELGQIRDVIVTMDGQVEGVVIGVGGFLGLGEKDVVVALDRLDIQRIGDDVRVTVLETRENLEAAEGFQQPRQQQ